MNRESITPTSREHWLELRRQDLTSTDVAALFGLSPYKTLFGLWHIKHAGADDSITPNERMDWGNRLERTIAEALCERMDWPAPKHVAPYTRLPEHRLGSSFDYSVYLVDVHLIECKNVDTWVYRDTWIGGEAPEHIELQVQHQLLVSGLPVCHIAALVGGNELIHIVRMADPEIQEQILVKAAEFWAMTEAPEPDLPADADMIGRLHSHAEPGKVLEVGEFEMIDDLAMQYLEAKSQSSAADKMAKVLKAQLLQEIGDAEKVVGPGWSISAGLVGPKDVAASTRKGYRNFRVTERKSK